MSSVRRVIPLLVATLLAILLGFSAPLVAPASASSAYLCTGYTACTKAGYSNSGYAAANSKMYWRMYAGHNCTNYAAYRMIRSGLANTRPWSSGSGNASNWGAAMKSITTTTPAVGSIAWWPANAPGAGSAGHVAYVEKVVSSSEIVISEDMWGGDFHWRDVKTGSRWPKGFIHFNDIALTSSALPTITGTPQVGAALTASPGTWTPAPTSYAYQWLAGGKVISGATSATYTPAVAQAGRTITVRVTAGKPWYLSGTATSAATAKVRSGTMSTTTPARISGAPTIGNTLTASKATWSPSASTQTVQWYAGGKAVSGATGWTLVLGKPQVGTSITAVVTATRPGYATTRATTAPAGPVVAGRIAVTKPFALSGANRVGETLSVKPGSYTPSNATVRYQWFRGKTAISGATASTHKLTSTDLGSQVSVSITLTGTNYLDSTSTLRTTGATTTRSTLTLSSAGKPGRAVVNVRVRATGVAAPTGRVTVKVGLRSAVVRLVHGRARAVVTGLTTGPRKVRAYYTGTSTIEPAQARGQVRLPRH